MGAAWWRRLSGAAAEFFLWWMHELAALIPPSVRTRFLRPDDRPILVIGENVLAISMASASNEDELVLLEQPAMSTGGLEVGNLGSVVKGRPTHIRFAASLGLARPLVLPTMSRLDIGNAVAFRIEELFPFHLSDVYFAYGGARPGESANHVEMTVAVIERDLVNSWLETLRNAGVEAASYGVADNETVLQFHRLPSRTRAWSWKSSSLLGLAACLLLALVIVSWHSNREAYIGFLGAATAKERQAAIEARRLSDQVAKARSLRAWLVAETEKPGLARLLESLAQSIPDTAWVENLEWKGRELRLQGFAADAVSLPKQVSAGGMLEDIQFRASMSNRADAGRERFDLTAAVKGGR